MVFGAGSFRGSGRGVWKRVSSKKWSIGECVRKQRGGMSESTALYNVSIRLAAADLHCLILFPLLVTPRSDH